jgi:hypothetical protein
MMSKIGKSHNQCKKVPLAFAKEFFFILSFYSYNRGRGKGSVQV